MQILKCKTRYFYEKILMTSVSAWLLMGSVAQAEDEQWYAGAEEFLILLGIEQSEGSVLKLQNEFKSGVGFAGIRMPVAESVDFNVKYLYMSELNSDFTDFAGDRFEANYDVHDFGVSFTYYYGAKKKTKLRKKPQPIMAAEPAPKPAPKLTPVV